MRLILQATLIATMLGSAVKAQPVLPQTVQQFYDACGAFEAEDLADEHGYFQFGACMGVVAGYSSLTDLNCQLDRDDTPERMKAGLADIYAPLDAIRQTMWNYVADNPSLWSLPVGTLAISISEEWPCYR